jgi:outer membrane biosynthesis protein TonB
MQDMIAIMGWVIALIALGTLILLVLQKKITKTDLVALLNAFLATEEVKNLKDKAWDEIYGAAKDKLKGTPVWPIFKKWYNEDDSSTKETASDEKKVEDTKKKEPDKKEEVKDDKKKDEKPEEPVVKEEEPIKKVDDKEDPDEVQKKKVKDLLAKKRAEMKAKTENKE